MLLLSCTSNPPLLSQPLDPATIDEVLVVLGMGNPDYGADSKRITDPDEIRQMVGVFNGATLGRRVRDVDLAVADTSTYSFYTDGDQVQTFIFNGNDSERLAHRSRWHYVHYPAATPYEHYRTSEAEMIVLDENLEPMERPE